MASADVSAGDTVLASQYNNLRAERCQTGTIMAFSGACPTGWSEVTAARGRMIVGTPSGGTAAGTVGTALTDLQDKTHTHTGPSHTHTGPSHTHTGPSHTHTMKNHTHTGPSHTHAQTGGGGVVGNFGHDVGGASSTAGMKALSGGGSNGQMSGGTQASGTGATGAPNDNTSDAGGTGATGSGGTGATGSGGTGATGTAATSDVLAYIQYTWCSKDA